jgi:nucleotide-binding universal stress UspA family protein
MFRRIVWATDGSSSADNALAYAKVLAGGVDGAELIVVHIDEILTGARAAFAPVDPDEPEARDKIERQVEDLRAAGWRASLRVATRTAGSAAQAIAELADEARGDVIVVGTHGHAPLAGLLLGSITHRLLHIAQLPVLVVPTSSSLAS